MLSKLGSSLNHFKTDFLGLLPKNFFQTYFIIIHNHNLKTKLFSLYFINRIKNLNRYLAIV